MDTTFAGVTLAAAAFAYALIRNARAYAANRRREAEFFARRLCVDRFGSGEVYGADSPQAQAVATVVYQRVN